MGHSLLKGHSIKNLGEANWSGALTLCFVVLWLGGCATPVEEDARYETVSDLRGAVEASGHDCDAFEARPDLPGNAIGSADCTSNSVISIYPDAASAQAGAEDVNELFASFFGTASVHLVGPNWTINCAVDLELCEHLQTSMGGSLVIG